MDDLAVDAIPWFFADLGWSIPVLVVTAVASYIAGMILHELGHAGAGWLVGLPPGLIRIGEGPVLLRFRLGSATFEMRLWPTWALVAYLPPPKGRIAARIFVTLSGPAVHAVILAALLVLVSQADGFDDRVFWSIAIGAPQLALLLISIIPLSYRWRGREHVTDMLTVLRLLRRGREEAASPTSDKHTLAAPTTTFSSNLKQSLHRAFALRNPDRRNSAIERLLLALIDDPDVATIMGACQVDRDRLRRDLVAEIEAGHEHSNPTGSEGSATAAGIERVLERAAAQVRSTRGAQLTGAGVLVAIFAERESRAVALMQSQDITRYDVTRYLSHGIAKGDAVSLDRHNRGDQAGPVVSDKPSGLSAKVMLLNDDYTPMEFVILTLERVFDMGREAAVRTMLETHHNGVGVCGSYPYDAAAAKVTQARELAREHQHPLLCVLE